MAKCLIHNQEYFPNLGEEECCQCRRERKEKESVPSPSINDMRIKSGLDIVKEGRISPVDGEDLDLMK